MAKLSAYEQWLRTFIQEKGLNTEHVFEIEGGVFGTNYIPLEVVIETICKCNRQEKEAIRRKIVMIDFHNGDVMHFFNHLAKALAI